MGGIIGSGIFINPYVVARQVHTPGLILGAWAIGGMIALAGAFIYAELADRRPEVGGQYAYLRDAYHPAVAFLYGWVLLLVIQTGGMAAVAVTFAAYFLELTHVPISPSAVAVLVLAGLGAVNCLGLRAGSSVQSGLMVLKILAIAALVAGGGWYLAVHGGARPPASPPPPASPMAMGVFPAMAAAMVPVLFAYGGWQTANFIAEEIREPRVNLPRALLLGVGGVVVLYLSVNFVSVAVLGPVDLAKSMTPASSVMSRAFGAAGSRWIAVGIAISALGFLSQSILTAPRVYYAMARDGVFFRSVGWLDPRHGVPSVAILLQAAMACVIALSGRYDQILSYVVSMDFLFFGLTATCLFVFRRREKREGAAPGPPSAGLGRVPGHPVTTVLFIAVSWIIVLSTILKYPANTAIGMGILAAGAPAYFLWKRRRPHPPSPSPGGDGKGGEASGASTE
ncbi:MAG: APC family permease, partial [Thermoanaerobaculia bacterium]